MSFLLTGCKTNQQSVDIICPTGAPSLALVGVYEDVVKEGKIDFVDGSDMLIAELSKTDSEYEVIVAPINLGTKLMSQGQTDYRLKSVLTWGNLYLVGTSQDALQQSGELALFGEGAVPQKIIDSVNLDTTLKPHYYPSTTLVQQKLLSGQVNVGMLAEPLTSATIQKAKKSGIELSIINDLQKSYGKQGYPQAAIFVKEGYKNQELFDSVQQFTEQGYPDLKEKLESIGIDQLGLPSVDITVSSIERQNVHYKEAKECEEEIAGFLDLFEVKYQSSMLAS